MLALCIGDLYASAGLIHMRRAEVRCAPRPVMINQNGSAARAVPLASRRNSPLLSSGYEARQLERASYDRKVGSKVLQEVISSRFAALCRRGRGGKWKE